MSLQDVAALDARLDAATLACERNGAQLTDLRRQVLRLILEAHRAPTAYQLLDLLRATRGNAVPPTIYRALDFLLEQRLIHRIESLNAFVPRTHAHHRWSRVQFLICRQCGTVAELDDGAVSTVLERAAEEVGFLPSRAVVELDGICAACARVSPPGE